MKIGSVNFQGGITVNGVVFTLERLQQVLQNSTAWVSTYSYSAGQFVSYAGKWYVSVGDNNLNNIPANNETYWTVYASGGSRETRVVAADTAMEIEKRYVCNNNLGLVLTLPVGEQNKSVAIAAQTLTSGSVIRINPQTGDTIASDTHLEIESSYGSVELIYVGTDWKVITPFIPQVLQTATTELNPSAVATTVSDSDVVFIKQGGTTKQITASALKAYLNS